MYLRVLVPAEPAQKQATGSTEVLPTVLLMRPHHPHHLEQSLMTRNDGATEQYCRSAFASGMSISISMWDNPGCEDHEKIYITVVVEVWTMYSRMRRFESQQWSSCGRFTCEFLCQLSCRRSRNWRHFWLECCCWCHFCFKRTQV